MRTKFVNGVCNIGKKSIAGFKEKRRNENKDASESTDDKCLPIESCALTQSRRNKIPLPYAQTKST